LNAKSSLFDVPIFYYGEFLYIASGFGSYYPGPGFDFSSFSFKSIVALIPIDFEGPSLPIISGG